MPDAEISLVDPRAADVGELLARHLAFADAQSPPQDVHALDVDGLLDPSVALYGLRVQGVLLGVGALKDLGGGCAEIKSMHTAESARGRGVGRTVLQHLLGVARDRGVSQVSLETGSVESFAPARALYASVGFTECEPFGDYLPSRFSTFMTLALAAEEAPS